MSDKKIESQNQQLFNLTVIVSSVVSGVIGFLAASIFFLFQPPTNPNTPIVVPPPSPVNTERFIVCAEETGPELQACCNNWALENEILTPQCVGEWKILEGVCNYTCSTIDATNTQ